MSRFTSREVAGGSHQAASRRETSAEGGIVRTIGELKAHSTISTVTEQKISGIIQQSGLVNELLGGR